MSNERSRTLVTSILGNNLRNIRKKLLPVRLKNTEEKKKKKNKKRKTIAKLFTFHPNAKIKKTKKF